MPTQKTVIKYKIYETHHKSFEQPRMKYFLNFIQKFNLNILITNIIVISSIKITYIFYGDSFYLINYVIVHLFRDP